MKTYNKHLIIVGTARSGTSWLSELLAQPFRYRLLYEPEHAKRTKEGHLVCDQWLQEVGDSLAAHQYLKKVFANQVDCDWIAQSSNRKYKMHLWPWLAKRYIIKFVRANLAAKYMNEVFDIPVIHMIRNPYSTIKSQQRANFEWLTDLSIYAEQALLVDLVWNRFHFDINTYKTLTQLEQLALRWCIENALPLEVLEPYKGKHKIVQYEKLYKNPEVYLNLCNYFNFEPISNYQTIITQPSSKTHPKSEVRDGKLSVYDWQRDELLQVNRILDIFKTKLYERRTV